MPRQTQVVKTLFHHVQDEAAARGVLPFARFMELALYSPGQGYYETQQDRVGRRGDFYTSVSTGELFGQLLAFQFSRWMEEGLLGRTLVEAGAHDGRLAKDILGWLQRHRPGLFEQIEYHILEPSPRRKAWQQETLREFPNVRWQDPAALGAAGPGRAVSFSGIFFSNELLDALPVHRLGWDARQRQWFEWGVAVEGEKFVWAKIPGLPADLEGELPAVLRTLPGALLDVLPDDYTVEACPAAEKWWRHAAGMLAQGKLLTIDYGHSAEELLSPARLRGTLRAYFRHRLSDDLLASPGEQDLTAHVNFSALQTVGEAAGLSTESFSTQSHFLTPILAAALSSQSLGEWDARRARQFQTLTHPDHLGRAFRVLVQSR